MDNWESNLKTRYSHKNTDLFDITADRKVSFLTSPSDQGVMRNGGRLGAKHAPACLLHHFKNLNTALKETCFKVKQVTSPKIENIDFANSQEKQEQLIAKNLSTHTFHLGGGHDHVFPFASALIKKHGLLNIINIDAHLDTRNDHVYHSGTPFRQLYEKFPGAFELHQVGIQNVANTQSNFEDVEMSITGVNDLKTSNYKLAFKKKAPLLFSIDCDGLDGSFMSAVSAHNPRGISQLTFESILCEVKKYWEETNYTYCGFYEFNPLFDNLAASSAKYIAHQISFALS